MGKRKKHQWQIDLEREQERLRSRPKLPAKLIANRPDGMTVDELTQLILGRMMGMPPAIILVGNPNYSSARCDVERNLRRIISGDY